MPADKIWDPIQKKEDEKLKEIRGRREGKPAHDVTADNKIGLACSGGGIRTATFNLGIMEVLREKGMLEKVDYLSTVSGGGFVGSWLTASELRNPGWAQEDCDCILAPEWQPLFETKILEILKKL